MSDISTVVQKAEKLCKLTRGVVIEAAGGLGALVAEQAVRTSLEDIQRRLDRAIEQLEAKRSFASITEEMLDSYRFENGLIKFTVPPGYVDPDIEAMKALNDFRWRRVGQDAISLGTVAWFQDLPVKYPELCEQHNPQEAREVELLYESVRLTRQKQNDLFSETDLGFGDIRDITMACALHELAFNEECLFAYGSCARTDVPDALIYNTVKQPTVRVVLKKDKPEYTCEGFYVKRVARKSD